MRKNTHTHTQTQVNDSGTPRTPLTDLMVYVVPKRVFTKWRNARITGDNDNSTVYNYIHEYIQKYSL